MGYRKQREDAATIHPSKTTTLVPKFEMEDLPLGRTAALVPEFVGQNTLMIYIYIYVCVCVCVCVCLCMYIKYSAWRQVP